MGNAEYMGSCTMEATTGDTVFSSVISVYICVALLAWLSLVFRSSKKQSKAQGQPQAKTKSSVATPHTSIDKQGDSAEEAPDAAEAVESVEEPAICEESVGGAVHPHEKKTN